MFTTFSFVLWARAPLSFFILSRQVNEAEHASNVERAYEADAVRLINPDEDPAVAHVYATLGDASATRRLHTQYHRVERTIVPQLETW
jgi:hypothetical protein